MLRIVKCRTEFLVAAVLYASACGAQTNAGGHAIFEFHNGFWVNLHQFLYHEATASKPESPDSPEWLAAIEYYRREIVPQGEMSPELTAVNNRLSAAGSTTQLPAAGLDPGLAATLAKAGPIYRRFWWPQHNRSNLAWIDDVQPLIAKYGAAIQRDIAAVYRVDWPVAPTSTDVSAFAGPNGAYTTTTPTGHITISSTDPGYQGVAALEMLFHEASHTLDETIDGALSSELKARNKLFRRRGFEHAIIFYTAGELARRYVAGYEPFAVRHHILENGWPGSLTVLEKDWKPYLEGRTGLSAAVQAIVADYGVPKNVP